MKIKSTSKLFGWLFKALNTTPYDGYIIFKFDLMPFRVYRVGEHESHLNKHYFSILAYKFVSRIVWNGKYIPERIEEIKKNNMQTGFVVIGGKSGQVVSRQMNVSVDDLERINAFPNYRAGVFNMAENYIGDLRFIWSMINKGYIADPRYTGIFFHQQKRIYFAHTLKTAAGFGIGDKLFDPAWVPAPHEIKWEWIVKYCKSHNIRVPDNIQGFLNSAEYSDLLSVIPFKQRGAKEISTLNEARFAARSFLNYVNVLGQLA